MLIGSGIAVDETIRQTFKERAQEKENLQANQMFFFHRAGQLLRREVNGTAKDRYAATKEALGHLLVRR